MSMFGGPKEGTWTISSESDPKWNKSGRASWLCCAGIHPDAEKWIQECEKKYGKQPKDLSYGFWKD